MLARSCLNCQGNCVAASDIYKEAIELAAEKRPHTLPMLYVHLARLVYMVGARITAVLQSGALCLSSIMIHSNFSFFEYWLDVMSGWAKYFTVSAVGICMNLLIFFHAKRWLCTEKTKVQIMARFGYKNWRTMNGYVTLYFSGLLCQSVFNCALNSKLGNYDKPVRRTVSLKILVVFQLKDRKHSVSVIDVFDSFWF